MDDMVEADVAEGRLTRVLADWCAPFSGYHLCYPSRRQLSPAFALLVNALRFKGESFRPTLAVSAVDSDEEALPRMNDSRLRPDGERVDLGPRPRRGFARELEFGTVHLLGPGDNSARMARARCAGCGLINDSGLASCRRCGAPLGDSGAQSVSPAPRGGSERPSASAPPQDERKATRNALVVGVGSLVAAIATIVSLLSHGGPVRDVRSQISHCLDVRRGLSRNVRIDLSFEPAPVFVSEPSDAFSFVTTACRNGAPVSLKVRDQTVVAMDIDGRKLFGVEEYEAAAARARTPGWVIAALLIALSALGFFVAVKKPRAAPA